MKILVVHNDPAAGRVLIKTLKEMGYEILLVSNGAEVLAMLTQEPEAVIMSIRLPDMDSFELCRRIREFENRLHIYIIMLSQTDEKSERINALLSGADVLLSRTAEADEVAAQLQAGMRRLGRPTDPDQHAPTNQTAQTKIMETPRTEPPVDQPPPDQPDPARTAKRDSIKISDTTKHDRVLAQIALTNKILTKKDLAEAFTVQLKEKSAGRKTALDEILLARKMITPSIREDLLVAVKRRLGKRFGAIAVQKGLATQEQVAMGLAEQAEEYKRLHSCRRLGDILTAKGVITEEQRDQIWLEQEAVEVLPSESIPSSTAQTNGPTEEIDDINPFALSISADAMTAHIYRRPEASAKGTLEQIQAILTENRIKHGLVPEDQILLYLNDPEKSHDHFLIAEGAPPVPGQDASIKYHFSTDYLIAGKINEQGDIDYKDRGERPRVSKGDVLAEKTPLIPGQAGMDILGNIIPATEAEDIPIYCDEGTELSPDSLKVIAAIDGEPNLTKSGHISVFDELVIKGDVDFSTGNIHFNGNIQIKGAVHDGFLITGGNITAQEIFAAEIEAAGDVTVTGGILGAKISTEGNVSAKYIDHANIKSFGNVIVQKEVRDSKIRASGEFKTETGAVISSYVAAKLGVKVKNIGTDVSEPCKIQIGIDENVRKRIQAYGFRHAEKTKILETLQNEYEDLINKSQELQNQIAQLAQVQDRAMNSRRSLSNRAAALDPTDQADELKQILRELKELDDKVKEADTELNKHFQGQEKIDAAASKLMDEIESIIAGIETIGNEKNAVLKWSEKNKAQALLRATGTIYSGTKILGRRAALALKEDVRNVSIREVKVDESEDTWELAVSKG